MQQTETIIESLNWTQWRNQKIMESQASDVLYIYNTAPASVVQKISQKRDQKDLSNKNTRKFAVEQPVLGMAT